MRRFGIYKKKSELLNWSLLRNVSWTKRSGCIGSKKKQTTIKSTK